jgi:rubredoxin
MAKAVKPKKGGAAKSAKPAAVKKNAATRAAKPVPAGRARATAAAPAKKPTAKGTARAKKAAVKPAVKKSVAKKPVVTKTAAKKPAAKKASGDMTRYKCKVCGYIYSPVRGEPHNGIPAGTPFDDLPDSYVCPICGMQGKGRIGKWGFEAWRPTRYLCTMCSYIYDEKRGEPHRGIRPGTKFEDLPDDYVCPVCALDPKISLQFGKVRKQGFEPINF